MIEKRVNRDEYFIPANEVKADIKVKGSKFIAAIVPVHSKEESEKRYVEFKKKFYDAAHNCFAYRINSNVYRYSDDGEPSGTAGKPIYNAIEAAELSEVLCVVTRYFGGTKLGTGGLIRAYGDVARLALGQLRRKRKILTCTLTLNFSYDLENLVRKILNEFTGRISESDYNARIEMQVEIPRSRLEQFKLKLIELSNSTIKIVTDE